MNFDKSLFKPAIFPLLQLGSFIACVSLYNQQPAYAALLLLASAFWLNFSIHIFFHECVHRSASYPAWFNLIASVFIGLPFDGYRVHHYNHHLHENGEKDLSTTWIFSNGNKAPRSALSYALGWPRQIINSLERLKVYDDAPGNIGLFRGRIIKQKYFLQVSLLLVTLINWKIALSYVVMIYLGWVFTAMQNYGQHPPAGENRARTYTNRLYNYLLFNNGLHWEHHNKPSLKWNELMESADSSRIKCPHMLNPIFNTGDKK